MPAASPPTSSSSSSDPDCRRAARDLVRRSAPAIYFSTLFLPRPQRQAIHACFAVHRQLRDILDDAGGCCGGAGQGACGIPGRDERAGKCAAQGTPGACGQGPCAAGPSPACAGSPAASTLPQVPLAAGGAATTAMCGTPGGTGCGPDFADTGADRRRVCLSVLDHLFRGEKTGKPELDGFHEASGAFGVSKECFVRLVDSVVAERSLRRFATWGRLHQQFSLTAGAAGELVASVLLGPGPSGETRLDPSLLPHLHAWCSGMRLAATLCSPEAIWEPGASSRLLLPLEDLVRSGLGEGDVARFAAAGTTAGDPRWQGFMASQRERVRNLLRGGARILEAVPSLASRQGAGLLALTYHRMLETLLQRGADPFLTRVRPTWFWRLRLVPAAVRLARSPRQADAVFR